MKDITTKTKEKPSLEEYISKNYDRVAKSGYYESGSHGARFRVDTSPGSWLKTWQVIIGSLAFFALFINFWYSLLGLLIIFLLQASKEQINKNYLKKQYKKDYPDSKT